MLMSPGLIPVGMLGPLTGLSINVSVALSIFATAVGAMVPAFSATLCPPTGLRQIAVSRYAFGIWGAKICGLLNMITNTGFAVLSCIFGGQLLKAVSDDSLPLVVGIIIVVVISYIVAFFGFGIVHQYERYAWIVAFILLCVQWAQSAKYFPSSRGTSLASGSDYTASCLNYFAVVFGLSAAWCSLSGDYYVHYPPDSRKWLVFGLTHMGICIPTFFVLILGNFYGGIVAANENLAGIYGEGGIGALILATMRPTAFAKFTAVVYVLSFGKSSRF